MSGTRRRNVLTGSLPPSGWRSDCPMCRKGIYGDDPTAWITKPVTGTVHEWCAPKEET